MSSFKSSPLTTLCFFVMSSRVPPWGWQPHGVAELRSLLVLCPGLGHSPRTQGFPLNAGRRRSVCLHSHSCHPSTCNHSRYTKRNSLYSLLVFLKAVWWIFVSSSNCVFSSWYLLKSWIPPHAPPLRILGLWQVFSFTGCISMPGGWLPFSTPPWGCSRRMEQATNYHKGILAVTCLRKSQKGKACTIWWL